MDVKEIKTEIARLEGEETTYQNCTRLAVLYGVVDRLDNEKPSTREYSFSGSEFMAAVSNAPADGVWEILDEHMEAVRVLHPKEFSAVIRRIKEISLP